MKLKRNAITRQLVYMVPMHIKFIVRIGSINAIAFHVVDFTKFWDVPGRYEM